MSERSCHECYYWRQCAEKDIAPHHTHRRGWCQRFPRWEWTPRDHSCGEYFSREEADRRGWDTP